MEKIGLSTSKLRNGVQEVLKKWHNLPPNYNPFATLTIFRQARQTSDSDQDAIQKLLQDAIDLLGTDQKDHSDLLRKYFIQRMTVQNIAQSRSISEPSVYRKKDESLEHLTSVLQRMEVKARETWQVELEQLLDIPAFVSLVGSTKPLTQLVEVINQAPEPEIICIDGLGGIGKTALASALLRQPSISGQFHKAAWVSAKQQVFLPGKGMQTLAHGPALNVETLIDALLDQLNVDITSPQSPQQKKASLIELTKSLPILIVIDNLETVLDYEALLPFLRKLTNPSKIVLTSRHSLRAYSGIYSLSLNELNQMDTLRLIQKEASDKGLAEIAEATDKTLQVVYDIVGGNPLALKLVVGQVSVLSLSEVLENLWAVKGETIEDLYKYIYWQTWAMLTEAAKKILLMMPTVDEAIIPQLSAATRLDTTQVQQGLQQLAQVSLVQVGGTLEHRRYTIHRLTENFLLNEALQWNKSM